MSNQDGKVNPDSPNTQALVPNLEGVTAGDLRVLHGIEELCERIADWAQRKGFWDLGTLPLDRGDEALHRLTNLQKSQKLMLMVSELGELLEALRKPTESKVPGFTNEEEELADSVIRHFDYAGHYRLRLAACILAKMAINEGRPFRHGKGF